MRPRRPGAAAKPRPSALQAASADKPTTEKVEFATVAAGAAESIVIDEADTRVLIDAQLVAAGWEADSQRLRHFAGARPQPRRAMAIAEWPTGTGPVDYALFVDGACVGVIEEAILASAFRGDLSVEQKGLVTVQRYLAAKIRNGLSVSGSDVPPGGRALKLSALKSDTVDLSDVRYLDIDTQRAALFALHHGDLLVSRGNGSLRLIGKAASVPAGCEEIIFPDTAFRLRPDRCRSDPRWLCWMWNAPQMRRQIETVARTTAGIWKISQADISIFELPDVGLLEQREIVRRIEHALAAIDRLAAEAASARALLDRLDQAVLAKAFRGELVPQDPDDEPAGVLLDRIRAERAAAPAPKRGRRPKAQA